MIIWSCNRVCCRSLGNDSLCILKSFTNFKRLSASSIEKSYIYQRFERIMHDFSTPPIRLSAASFAPSCPLYRLLCCASFRRKGISCRHIGGGSFSPKPLFYFIGGGRRLTWPTFTIRIFKETPLLKRSRAVSLCNLRN